MARKRINTKFIIVLGVIVLGLMLAVLLAKKFIIKEKPDKYLAVGREMMDQGKYEEAAKNFRRALALDSKNPDIWVEFGDSMNQLSGQDPEFLRRAREAWEQARNIDPTHKQALTRLLTFWSELADLEARPDPGTFEQIRKTASDLAKVDPNNTAAQAAIHSAIIRRWLGGVETDSALIDKAVEQLTQLMAKHPENPDLPAYIAKAKLQKADRARQRGAELGDAEANKLISEADAIIETAVKNQPKSAAMQFGGAQVLEQEYFDALRQAARYANFDPNPKNTDRQNIYNREQHAKYTAQAEKYAKRKREMLTKAQEFVQPEDTLYTYIHIAAAQSAAQTDDRAGAEKILRNLLAKKPDDQQVRLALAEHIASGGKRDEAITILDREFVIANIKGPKSLVARALEVRTLAAVTAMRLDAYQSETNNDNKKKLEGQIQDGISKIVLKEGDSVRSNLLRGKLLRAQNKQIEAIQTLEKARQLTEKQSEGQERTLERWEIHDLLARSYIETRQTGRAKALLEALVQKFDNYQPARILLAQLLIREQQMDQARVHIDILREQAPTSPDVVKLQLQVLDPQTQQAQIAALLKQLPEKEKKEAIDKVNTAMVVKQNDEALRIMQRLEKEFPKDDEIFRLAFKVYRALERYDLADATVKRAKEVHPDSPDIQIVSGYAASRPTTQATIAIRQQMIEKEPDAFQKELLKAEFARNDGKTEEELNALKAAAALKPDDSDVKLALFNLYLKRKQFEMAANYLEPLGRVNKDQVNGLLLRYRFAMAKGDINGGIELGRKLVSQMPEFGQSWLALAEALQAAQQYDEALQRYLSALDKQSDNASAYRGAIECYYALNRKEEAKRMIAKARSVLPNNQQFVDMELNHALTYDDPESMIKGREDELKKQPDNPNVLLMAGRTYVAAARYRLKKDPNDQTNATALMTKARELFMQGIAKWPDEPAFYAYCAEASAQKKDLPQAEQVLKKLAAREQWKNRPEPLMLLGEFYSKTNRGEDAIKVLQQAMSMAPTNVDVEMRLATVLAEQKKFDDAIKALLPNAEDPRIVRRRIEILVSAGKADEADKAWQAAVAKMPNMADLRAWAARSASLATASMKPPHVFRKG
jgi:tetratricopeptide (TPR) repeat protein